MNRGYSSFTHKIVLISAQILIFTAILCPVGLGKYSGGSGQPSDPYLISTPNDLNAIGLDPNDWNKFFLMTTEINLAEYTGSQFNIIGDNTNSFTGYFDGNNHTISNFNYSSTGTNYIGLFGHTGASFSDSGQIWNVTLTNVDVNGGTGSYIGGLVGYARGSVINCSVDGGLVRGQSYVGGLAGFISSCTVVDCSSLCDVNGTSDVGGLAGYTGNGAVITECYATGCVTGDTDVGGLVGTLSGQITRCYAAGQVIGKPGNNSIGGLVGATYPDSSIEESYAKGTVQGEVFIGGLLGFNWETSLTHCYSVGSVWGTAQVGGFIGNNNSPGPCVNCFWDYQSSGQTSGVGAGSSDNIYGKTTEQMKTQTTFTNAGWDFNTPVWSIDEGVNYPILIFQEYASDYGGGRGTAQDPFLIYTPEHMQEIGTKKYHWGMNFKLMDNIDLSQYDGQDGRERFNKIGYYNSSSDYLPFTGVFDGNNCTISNFNYITTTEDMVGLFGYAEGEDVIIKNLGLINPNVSADEGYQQIAGLVGQFKDGSLENCYVHDANVTGGNLVGALVGRLRGGVISNCYATGKVAGQEEVGGMVGRNDEGEIRYCQADVSVSASSYVSGGLLGELDCGLVYGCSAHGDVNGADIVGGLIGTNATIFGPTGPRSGDIIDCYATGNVSSEGSAGGLVSFSGSTLIRCSASGSVKGRLYVGGLAGNAGGTIQCYATGDVSGEDDVGGLTGTSAYVMSDSFALGDVNGRYNVGGLSGRHYGTIQNCFSAGFVSGSSTFGGLVGYNLSDGNIVNSFWDEQTSGLSNMCGIGSSGSGCDNSYGKTTTEMMNVITFTSVGWDFVGETTNGYKDAWRMCQNTVDYPRLAREFSQYGDFVCPDGVDFIDYSVLADQWQLEKLQQDFNFDGLIDFCDWAHYASDWDGDYSVLETFLTYWLARSARQADIAPLGGDDIVNWLDLKLFCENWLEE